MSTATPTPPHAGIISVVDDKADNLNMLEVLLAQEGYRVSLFPRGELALAAARADPPDLVLLDICMPDLDGYEVCRRFKAEATLRPIPILFLSALSDAKDLAAGFACGGVDYIAKPFRAPELLARVRTHIALRRAYAELALKHAHLRILERQRDTFVHMLVHDLRSPLQVMLGHLDLVHRTSAGLLAAEDLDSLCAAIHATRLLAGMVSTVVDISRMETTNLPLHRQVVSVGKIFQAARSQALDPARRASIVENIAAPCPRLFCDSTLTVRIVSNLLGNALKHSPNDGTIVLGAASDPSGVRLWVQDQGPGIPLHEQQQIFEKFGVAEKSIGSQQPSTGLGLAFCKLAVEAQGGTLGVESALGQGSTFWFTLPGVAPAATAEADRAP